MKAHITSGTIKFNGKNIEVKVRECDAKGNKAQARDGRVFFSDRRTGYVEIKEG